MPSFPSTETSAPGNGSAANASAAAALAASAEQEEVLPGTEESTSTNGAGDGTEEATAEDLAYARSQGWVERDKFRGDRTGDKSGWVDAKTYAARAREVNPIINARNRELTAQIETLKRENDQIRRDAEAAIKGVRAQSTREYQAKLNELQAKRAAAIDDSDGALVVSIEREIAELPKPEEAPKPVADTGYPKPLVEAAEKFSQRNPWYGDGPDGDPDKTGLATATARTLLRERPDLKGTPAFFTELEYQLRADHPDVFKPKQVPAMVDGAAGKSAGRSNGSAKKTLADLPKDAQDTAKRFVRNGWLKTEQEYVEQYFAVEAENQQ